MINAIPVIGWLISAIFSFSMAVPFFYIWNELAPTYAYWLPAVYLKLPFWHIVGIFMIVPILKVVFVPKFSNVTQTVKRPKKVPEELKDVDAFVKKAAGQMDTLNSAAELSR